MPVEMVFQKKGPKPPSKASQRERSSAQAAEARQPAQGVEGRSRRRRVRHGGRWRITLAAHEWIARRGAAGRWLQVGLVAANLVHLPSPLVRSIRMAMRPI